MNDSPAAHYPTDHVALTLLGFQLSRAGNPWVYLMGDDKDVTAYPRVYPPTKWVDHWLVYLNRNSAVRRDCASGVEAAAYVAEARP